MSENSEPKYTMRAPGAEAAEASFPGSGGAADRTPRLAPAPAQRQQPSRSRHLPVDSHLVKPEQRWEIVDGQRMYASPAKAPHADRQFALDFALHELVAPGYVGATDLLTRWDEDSDFATDTSIRRAGTDPTTGRRYLEEVAFEIANSQTRSALVRRTQKLIERGVRRVFAIFIKDGSIEEWSAKENRFVALDLDSQIEDPCFVRSFKARALLDAVAARAAVADALIASDEPSIVELRHKERAEGHKEGRAEGHKAGRRQELVVGIEAMCDVLDIALTQAQRERLVKAELDELLTIRQALRTTKQWPTP